MSNLVRILVVDDNAQIARGLVDILGRRYPEAEVLSAGSVAEATGLLNDPKRPITVVLLDLILPDNNGVVLLEHLHAFVPPSQVAVIVVSGVGDGAVMERCRSLGARGYVPKSRAADWVEEAIESVLKGGTFFIQDDFPDNVRDTEQKLLTDRQYEVAQLVSSGRSNKEITDLLGVPAGVVKNVLLDLMRIFKVTSRPDLIASIRGSTDQGGPPG